MSLIAVVSLLSLVGSYAVTGFYRTVALKTRILDVPNHRSSHKIPVPRGGGIAIVSIVFAGILILLQYNRLDFVSVKGYLPVFLLALVGFIDDRYGLSIKLRLTAQVVTVASVLYLLFAEQSGESMGIRIAILALSGVYLLWVVNLYNFMDGIDGIASIQAITVLGSAVFLLCIVKDSASVDLLLPSLVMGAAIGFLVWNWPPASIFMGDCGSLFLGLWIGVFSLITVLSDMLSLWAWLILMAVFFVDATYTLLHRLFTGERVYQAHNRHAYQLASRVWGHKTVTLTVLSLNLFWLLPLAYLVHLSILNGVLVVFIAYTPLILLELLVQYRWHEGLQSRKQA